MLNNRLTLVDKEVTGESQTRLMKGRNILEGVLILCEAVHELKTHKKIGLIMKIDFEKAYDKVRLNFLEEVVTIKGFLKM
jgi:hypothetical protein